MTPTPNPEVYRTAARLLAEADLTAFAAYSCHALRTACTLHHLGYATTTHYSAQYENTFGPNHSDRLCQDDWGYLRHPRPNGDIYHIDPDIAHAARRAHPFWSHRPTEEYREYRILALLLMAELVENP